MKHNRNQIKKPSLQHTKPLELGTRKVSRMNFSDVMTIPKTFTKNYLGENRMVNVIMLDDGSLKIIPIPSQKKKKGKN